MDGANLIFHEGGHFLFMIFGETMHFLGGTLMQILIPIICGLTFIKNGKIFEATVMGIWLGENFLDTSDYVADAQKQLLPLIGGESSTHDWNWLLNKAGIIEHAEALGTAVYIIGAIIIALSIGYAIKITFINKS